MKRFNLLSGLAAILVIAPSLALCRGTQRRRYRLDVDGDRAGPVHDPAGPVPVLRRAGQFPQCPQRADAVLFDRLSGFTVLWVIFGYSLAFSDGGAGNPVDRGAQQPVHGRSQPGGDVRDDPGDGLCHVPADVRRHYPGAGHRRLSPSACASLPCSGSRPCGSPLVYLPVCHWVWGGGWLAEMGVLDFAGGLVVHLTAGVASPDCRHHARPAGRLSRGA